MRVIVIGSGIGGLTTAIAMRKVGFNVVIYERAPELREVGAGISLWANAMRALDHLGVGNAIRKVSLALVKSELRTEDGRQLLLAFGAEFFEKKLEIRPLAAMTHRAELVGALAAALPSGSSHYGFECVSIKQSGGRAVVQFANGHADEAELLVGADGLNSVVRTSLLGPEEPRYAGYTCWRGVCPRPTSIEPGYAGEWWGRGKRFGIATLPADRLYWYATYNTTARQHARDEQAAVADLFRGWAEPVPDLIASTPSHGVLRNDIMDRKPARKWSDGRVVLIGDAAHPTTPNLGQGGCMAIEDGIVLARSLATCTDTEQALKAFTVERFKRVASITQASWHLGKVSQWENRAARWMRDRAVQIIFSLLGTQSLSKHASFDVGPLPRDKPISY
jgi:2-polyprenyl-6-methoxyphenol hydroxylase-like FAD-dependent oxidoreductase